MPPTVLTQKAIDAAKPSTKPIRLFDGQGLYLEISSANGRLRRLNYRFLGEEKRLALGKLPEVSLKQARQKAFEARSMLAAGQDPGEVHRTQRRRLLRVGRPRLVRAPSRHQGGQPLRQGRAPARALRVPIHRQTPDRDLHGCGHPGSFAAHRRPRNQGNWPPRPAEHRPSHPVRHCNWARNGRSDACAAWAPVNHRHMAAPADDPQAVGKLLRMLDAFKGGPVVATGPARQRRCPRTSSSRRRRSPR